MRIRRKFSALGAQVNGKDDGMSMVELIVYIMLFSVVGTLVTALLLNVFRVNTNVKSTSENSNDAQVIMERVEIAVRNATAFNVVESGDGSQLLVTETRFTSAGFDADTDLRCIGIYYSASSKTLHYLSEPAPSTRIKAASTSISNGTGWQQLASDVHPVTGKKLFEKQTGAVGVHLSIGGSNPVKPVQNESLIDVRSVGGSKGGCF